MTDRTRSWFIVQARFGMMLGLAFLTAACQQLRPTPTPTAIASPTPVEAAIVDLPGRGVQITGHGDSLTPPITPQYTQGITVGISVVTAAHDGKAAFTLQAVEPGQPPAVLVAATGHYQGSRPLVVEDEVSFQVKADGDWSIRVEPLRSGAQPAFSGAGDNVSQFFDPPPPGQWEIVGGGKNLNVRLHCISGDAVVVDDANGPLDRAVTITFSRGPCFWEVQSDGTWSLKPQGGTSP